VRILVFFWAFLILVFGFFFKFLFFKLQAEEKLGFVIGKFLRKEDESEVEDNDVLQELLKSEKEVWLIAKKKSDTPNNKHLVKISTLNQKDPSSIDADNLKLLKEHGTYFFRNLSLFEYRNDDYNFAHVVTNNK
jgi:hypothetical protein